MLSDYDFVIPAPAKLNLFLHITGQRSDGYHLLQTIFQMLDYGDQIGLRVNDGGEIRRTSDLPGVNPEDDLVVRAAKALQRKTRCTLGADIFVEKVLPMGGGIGGGSSNAASVLLGLNHLWKTGLTLDELAELGLTLGADVPVFVRGMTCWAEGVGEDIREIVLPEKWYVVLTPNVSISTPKLFSNKALTRDCSPITIRDLDMATTQNVFEPLVREMYPEVDATITSLSLYSDAKLTGTGACVFAAFDSEEEAKNAFSKLSKNHTGFLAKGVNQSPAHVKI